MNQISFTIPLTSSALSATITALTAMNNDLSTTPTMDAVSNIVVPVTITETPSAPITETPKIEVELDSAGQAWDEELHTSTRTKIADGTWKKKRAVVAPPVDDVITEGKPQVVTPPTGSIAPPKAEVTTLVSPFRALLSDIAKAGLAPDYVQATCLEVTGGNLVQCKDDADALGMLRMSLGL